MAVHGFGRPMMVDKGTEMKKQTTTEESVLLAATENDKAVRVEGG